jgi:hypothetical protein
MIELAAVEESEIPERQLAARVNIERLGQFARAFRDGQQVVEEDRFISSCVAHADMRRVHVHAISLRTVSARVVIQANARPEDDANWRLRARRGDDVAEEGQKFKNSKSND